MFCSSIFVVSSSAQVHYFAFDSTSLHGKYSFLCMYVHADISSGNMRKQLNICEYLNTDILTAGMLQSKLDYKYLCTRWCLEYDVIIT